MLNKIIKPKIKKLSTLLGGRLEPLVRLRFSIYGIFSHYNSNITVCWTQVIQKRRL
jgi:hypothetical protein